MIETFAMRHSLLNSLIARFESESKIGSMARIRFGDLSRRGINAPKDDLHWCIKLLNMERNRWDVPGLFLFVGGRILFWNENLEPQWTSIDSWYLTDLRRQLRDHIEMKDRAREYDLKMKRKSAIEAVCALFDKGEIEVRKFCEGEA